MRSFAIAQDDSVSLGQRQEEVAIWNFPMDEPIMVNRHFFLPVHKSKLSSRVPTRDLVNSVKYLLYYANQDFHNMNTINVLYSLF
jgi:hypothetical protein